MKSLSKKFYRFQTSKKYLKIIKFYHQIFKEPSKLKIDLPIYNSTIHRKYIVNKIIDLKNYKTYLEIGCDQDELFSSVKIEKKIGVDPNNGGTHRMKSDLFFEENNQNFDIVFIDGLHEYHQVKKDILNSINCLNPNGIVLVHDCFPMSYYDQAIPRAQRKWNGDVWKAITELRTFDNLNICVGAFDNGIGLIQKKNNQNKLLLKTKIKDLKYTDYFNNYNQYLNLLSVEEFFKFINDKNE